MRRLQPGVVRDGIEEFLRLSANRAGAEIEQITQYLDQRLKAPVAPSSVRSYLRLNTPGKFERVGRGKYRLASDRSA